MPTDSVLLAEVPFFQLLDEHERLELAKQLDVVEMPKGQLIFSYGDPGESLFVIRKGEVEIFFKDDTGTRIVLEVGKPGSFFGELSLLDGGPRTASALVTADLEALRLDRAGLDEFRRNLFALVPYAPVAEPSEDELPEFLVYRPEPKARPWRLLRADRGFRVVGKPPSDAELERALRAAGARSGAEVEIGEESFELAP